MINIDGKPLLNFCSNNYLSLAGHPNLVAAAHTATQKFGASTAASHLIVGHTELHHKLEEKIAQFVGAEKAILFSTGYMANLAIPTTFLGRHDLLVQDRLNHASIIDAARMSDAKLRRYRHADSAAANEILAASESQPKPARKMVVTDGVFSMDGDLAPLNALRQSCNTHEALLVVDDAHGLGVIGNKGRGSLSSFNLKPRANILMLGTLSKAAGSFGAFVAGDAVYIDTLIQHARSFIYTTALPASAVAASVAAIELFESEQWRREKLNDNIQHFRKLAVAAGIATTESTTAIQPIIVGDSAAALTISEQLKEQGIMALAIRPPTVAVGQARIRITLMADHTENDIQQLVAALEKALLPSSPARTSPLTDGR
jgi:8-amino-7-oxononanoate synthase